MNHHGFSENFRKRDPIGEKSHVRFSVNAEQRRHIARVVRMRAMIGIFMCARVSKGIFRITGTGSTLMNMKPEQRTLTAIGVFRQPAHRRLHQHCPLLRIELHFSPNAAVRLASAHRGFCRRTSAGIRQE